MKKKNQKEIFLGQFLSVLSLSGNRLCLKFAYDMTQQIITVYFYGSVCVSHTLLYVCVCVCACVCAWQTKHLHTVPYKCGCKNSWIACSFKVSSCFVKPKLFNVFIDFKSFNFRPFYMAFHICFTLVRTRHNTGTNISTEFSRWILYFRYKI